MVVADNQPSGTVVTLTVPYQAQTRHGAHRMSPSRETRRSAILLLVLVALVVAGADGWRRWSMLPLDGTAITIDGERFSLADLGRHGTPASSSLIAVRGRRLRRRRRG